MFLSGGYASDAYATGMKRLILVLAVIMLVLPWWLGVALAPVIVVPARPRGARNRTNRAVAAFIGEIGATEE